MEDSNEELKEIIEGTISDLVSGFLYYDRKEDEELPRGEIERLLDEGVITAEWIVEKFAEKLREYLSA
jgi:hypothetical protein